MFKLYSVDIGPQFLKNCPLDLWAPLCGFHNLGSASPSSLAKDSDQSLGFAGDWSRARGEVDMPEILRAEIVKQ